MKRKKMKRKIINEVISIIRPHVVEQFRLPDDATTVIQVVLHLEGETLMSVGVAKKSWLDKPNCKLADTIALNRAIFQLAERIILRDQEEYERAIAKGNYQKWNWLLHPIHSRAKLEEAIANGQQHLVNPESKHYDSREDPNHPDYNPADPNHRDHVPF